MPGRFPSMKGTKGKRESMGKKGGGTTEDGGKRHRERIMALVDPVLHSQGLELVEVECLRMPSRWLVRIYMDREGGVTVDDCAAVSHEVGDILNAHDVPPGPYLLEVSSPGLDRPLVRDEDFLKHRGSPVRLKLREPLEGRKNFAGRLIDYMEDGPSRWIVIERDGQTHRIPREHVARARLDYEI